MNLLLQKHIENYLNQTYSTSLSYHWQSVGGGSINETYKVSANSHSFFVKTNVTTVFNNGFKEEVLGLQFLQQNKATVPEIITEGIFENHSYLVLAWIENGTETKQFWRNFAQQLAKVHQQKNDKFGLDYSNYMGQLPQNNSFFDSFSDFFIENRLKPQVKMAFDNNKLQKKHLAHFEEIYKQLPTIFPIEKPAAVHGDLWSGNYMCSSNEKPILIDPAAYYGHREVDIAMTQLFGGFSEEFYKSYQEIYPLEPCFNIRNNFYNLYPLLIHLNLFGDSYLGSIEHIITEF